MMNPEIVSKLEKLRHNFEGIKGVPFLHFFCPILLKDEDVPLCKAHIVNKAFPESPRAWTIQRHDVDNFFGTNFEADFVAIQYKELHTIGDTITDKKLSGIFSPEISVDETPADFFVAQGKIPDEYTPIEFDNDGQIIRLGIKMPPDEFTSLVERNWEISSFKRCKNSCFGIIIKSCTPNVI